ncbi:hypothetical protein [Halorussus litoreus]|uniref:hypothetical protein n=1 Tax=Halorussus litoreus TaxID=1710536 RepID=UPI000E2748CF|nr:hypothetical protein [Halorussus litoreus]
MGAHTDSTSTDRTNPYSSLGKWVLVLASVATSVAAYARLPETIRIRWTVGTYPQYGPEHAPTLLVLAAFPAVVVALALGARWLRTFLDRTGEFEEFDGEFRAVYDGLVLLGLVLVVGAQLLVVILNL